MGCRSPAALPAYRWLRIFRVRARAGNLLIGIEAVMSSVKSTASVEMCRNFWSS